MPITQFYEFFFVNCHFCPVEEVFDSLEEAKEWYKSENGWSIKEDKKWGWIDVCPECVNNMPKDKKEEQ